MDDSNQAARLRGRRILITGASSGVGLAAASLFAREGAELVLVSRRADLAAEQLEQRGLHAFPVCADLGDREAAEEAVRTAVEELGGLDVHVGGPAGQAGAEGHDIAALHRSDEMDGGHDATLSRPRELTDRLHAHAASLA